MKVDELVAVWCERAELELRHKQPLVARDVTPPPPVPVFTLTLRSVFSVASGCWRACVGVRDSRVAPFGVQLIKGAIASARPGAVARTVGKTSHIVKSLSVPERAVFLLFRDSRPHKVVHV